MAAAVAEAPVGGFDDWIGPVIATAASGDALDDAPAGDDDAVDPLA